MSKHPLPIEPGTLGERTLRPIEYVTMQGYTLGEKLLPLVSSPGAQAAFERGQQIAERLINEALLGHDFPPPDLPLHPDRHAVQRIPDVCPDDWRDETCVCHEQSGPCRRCHEGLIP
jgi:hypothetical protein